METGLGKGPRFTDGEKWFDELNMNKWSPRKMMILIILPKSSEALWKPHSGMCSIL